MILSISPDYNDLPVPDQNKEISEIDENKIKDLVLSNNNKENREIDNSEEKKLNIENSILKKIKN